MAGAALMTPGGGAAAGDLGLRHRTYSRQFLEIVVRHKLHVIYQTSYEVMIASFRQETGTAQTAVGVLGMYPELAKRLEATLAAHGTPVLLDVRAQSLVVVGGNARPPLRLWQFGIQSLQVEHLRRPRNCSEKIARN
jgi:hypothetical protein